jgi:hypothetical protein
MKKVFLILVLAGCFSIARAGNLKDACGTITLGGSSQTLLAASTTPRQFFFFQNQSIHVTWLQFGGAAAVQSQPSIQVPANGGTYRMDALIEDGAVTVISSATGDAFTRRYR